jgi:hypothetical protein
MWYEFASAPVNSLRCMSVHVLRSLWFLWTGSCIFRMLEKHSNTESCISFVNINSMGHSHFWHNNSCTTSLLNFHHSTHNRSISLCSVFILKNGVFWDVTPCGCCKRRRFGGTYRLHRQGDKNRRGRNNISSNWQPKYAAKKYYTFRLLVTANVLPISPLLVSLVMEALCSSETSVLTRATWRISQKTAFFIVTAVKTSNLT